MRLKEQHSGRTRLSLCQRDEVVRNVEEKATRAEKAEGQDKARPQTQANNRDNATLYGGSAGPLK